MAAMIRSVQIEAVIIRVRNLLSSLHASKCKSHSLLDAQFLCQQQYLEREREKQFERKLGTLIKKADNIAETTK